MKTVFLGATRGMGRALARCMAERGDEIFLLGFSRGAYTARSVAGLIGALGLLSRDGMQYFKAVYSLYKAAKTTSGFAKALKEWIAREGLEGTDWRIEPGNVEIKAVACWETVGALGFRRIG